MISTQRLWILCLAAFVDAGPLLAPSLSVAGDAQSSCVAPADAWFKANYSTSEEHVKGGSGKATYTTHFSLAKNACFMEVVATAHVGKNSATPAFDSEIRRLVNLKTGQEIGQLVVVSTDRAPLACKVADFRCAAAADWIALSRDYMKD